MTTMSTHYPRRRVLLTVFLNLAFFYVPSAAFVHSPLIIHPHKSLVEYSTLSNKSRGGPVPPLQAARHWNPFYKPPPPPPPTSPSELIRQQSEAIRQQLTELAKHSALLGNLKAFVSKFQITPAKTKMILGGISHIVLWEELFFFAFMGWGLVPLLNMSRAAVRRLFMGQKKGDKRSFARSKTKLVADNVAGISKIACFVYISDIVKILLQALGFKHKQVAALPTIVYKILTTWWVVNRISALKRYFLAINTRNTPGDLQGSAEVVDHLFDAFLYAFGAYLLINSLQSSFTALKGGLATLGGASTLVVSLASQGLVTQVFYGLFLSASNKFRKGDVVQFGDGKVAGFVANVGWTDTLIRGSDGVNVSVPNRELDKPIRNLSRIQMSSVKQDILFKHTDAEKIPKFLEDVKKEIANSCPQLITDGSRPFRVVWAGYNKKGLEVSIEAHFRIKLLGDPYWENRQNMLVAINRAVKKHGMEFAVEKKET